MAQVRRLAPKTREGALRLVGALLRKHFGDDGIRFDAITAEHVRRFFAAQAKLYKTPSSLGVVVSALRGYLRWRATLGDRTHGGGSPCQSTTACIWWTLVVLDAYTEPYRQAGVEVGCLAVGARAQRLASWPAPGQTRHVVASCHPAARKR